MRAFLNFSLIATAIVWMPTSWALDLVQAYDLAKENDPTIASATAQYQAMSEKSPQALSYLLPNVSLSAAANRSYTDVSSPAGSYDRYHSQKNWSLSLSQPLINIQSWVNYDQSKLIELQAETQLFDAKQNLILRVAQSYFDVVLAEQTLDLTRQQKAAISEQLAAAKARFEVGASTIPDAKEAQASFDNIVAQEIRAEADLDNNRHALELFIGKHFDGIYLLKDSFVFPSPTPEHPTHWVEAAKENAWPVVSAQLGKQIAERQIKYARAGHYPTVNLVASRGWDRADAPIGYNGNSTTDSSKIGIQVTIPIFQGGYVSSKVREATALDQQARYDLAGAQRDASLLARKNYLAVVSGKSEVSALEQALISDQAALDANLLGYEVGVRVNIDVLNSQATLYNTKLNLAKAKINLLLAQLSLKASVGNLTDEELLFINRFLEKKAQHDSK